MLYRSELCENISAIMAVILLVTRMDVCSRVGEKSIDICMNLCVLSLLICIYQRSWSIWFMLYWYKIANCWTITGWNRWDFCGHNYRAKIWRQDYRSIDAGFLSIYYCNFKSQGNHISLTFFCQYDLIPRDNLALTEMMLRE